jgi:hypothetical protein
MRRFRFHLGTLVILVLLLGVGLAALRQSSETWDSSIFSITLGVLLISILLAVHRSENRRAFWLGFALFGSVYLGLSFVPSTESRLITTKALTYLDSKLPRAARAGLGYLEYLDFDNDGSVDLYVADNAQSNALYGNKRNGTFANVTWQNGLNSAGKTVVGDGWLSNVFVRTALVGSSGTTMYFLRIGHSFIAVVVALLGGQLSKYFYVKSRQRTAGPVPVPESNSSNSRV